MRVLVVRFGRVGDLLVVTPALRALRKSMPDGRIEVLTTATGAEALATNPHVDAVHVLNWRRIPAAINPERARLIRRLRQANFDAVFLFEDAQRYRKLARALRVPRLYTYPRVDDLSNASPTQTGVRHATTHFARVLTTAGIAPDGVHYDYPISETAYRRARALLAANGIAERETIAGAHAGHFVRRRRSGPQPRQWPPDRYVEVIHALAARGADRVILTGSSNERDLNQRIVAALPKGMAVDLAGATDLETLAAVIERCAVFIAPDTGPGHLAAAVGTPVVALFGPKSPDLMGPVGDETRIRRLYPEPSSASPRERGGYDARLWAITVADVLAAVDELNVFGKQ